ncbi:MAG TPA: hypothetical protein VGN17_20135 [Bryobacteraceae bacterium]|jgi:hypothetical protein
MYESLAWAVAAIAFCSLWAVQSWVTNRRQEREAYYRTEAIKKVAEMQGNVPEPVMSMLREALTPPTVPSPWVKGNVYTKEREAFYRSEVMKKIAESPGAGAEAALQVMREEENRADRRTRAGLRLGGLVVTAVGIGVTVFLYAIVPDVPVFLAGLIPTLIGLALLAYSYILGDHHPVKP